MAVNQVANVTESLTTTDNVTALKNCKPVGAIETHETFDSVAVVRVSIFTPVVTENLSESDSVTRLRCVLCQPPLIESHNTNDSVTAVKHISVSPNVSETLTLTDSCKGVPCRAAGAIETHLTNDAVTGVKTTHGQVGAVSETLTTTATVSGVATKLRVLTENLSTVDSVAVVRCGAVAELLTTTDTVSAKHVAFGALTESNTTSDSVTGAAAHLAFVTELKSTTDSVTAINPAAKSPSVSETLANSQSVSTSATHVANLTESNTTLSSVTAIHAAVAGITESLSTRDNVGAVTHNQHPSVNVQEFLGIADVVNTSGNIHQHLVIMVSENNHALDQVTVTNSSIPKNVSVSEAHFTQDAVSGSSPLHADLHEFNNTVDNIGIFIVRSGKRRRFVMIDSQ